LDTAGWPVPLVNPYRIGRPVQSLVLMDHAQIGMEHQRHQREA
jgi:hypothetical protein